MSDESKKETEKLSRHDRHSCSIYRKTISPCKDCLPALAEVPVPMCKDVNEIWGDDAIRAKTLAAISAERTRHKTLDFSLNHTNDEWVTIMAEELGEIAKAVHQNEGKQRITEEAVQLAAAAVAFCEKVGLDWRKA